MLTRYSADGKIQCVELKIPQIDFDLILPAYEIVAKSKEELQRKINEDVEGVRKACIDNGDESLVQVLILSESDELNFFRRTVCIYSLGDLSKWK